MTDYKEQFEHLSPVWTHYSDIIVDHGEGTYLYATDGRKYMDFACGIGVTNTGHCHPKVVAAIRKQAGLLLHGQANLVTHKPMLELVEEMRTIVPKRWMDFSSPTQALRLSKALSSWPDMPQAERM